MALNRKKPAVQMPSPSASSSSETEDSSGSSEDQQEAQHSQPVSKPTLKPYQQQEEKEEKVEEEEDDDDEEEQEEEESDEPVEAVALEVPSSKNPQIEPESEEEESDSDEDGKAVKLSSVSDFTLKPRTPKPPSVLTKRAAADAEINLGSSKNNKKAKASNGDGQIVGSGDDANKSAINRVWSEQDEIALLEAILAYKIKNGSNSIANLSAFHETLTDLNLSLEVTKNRLYDKVRGLKKKYQRNVKKEQHVFSKPNELKLFIISEKIWGGEGGGFLEESGSKIKGTDTKTKKAGHDVSGRKVVGKKDIIEVNDEKKDASDTKTKKAGHDVSGRKAVGKKDIIEVNDEKKDPTDVGSSSFPRLGVSLESQASTYLPMTAINPKEFTKRMIHEFGKQKAKELEKEWEEYSEMEYQFYAKRLQIIGKQAEAVSEVLKHSYLN